MNSANIPITSTELGLTSLYPPQPQDSFIPLTPREAFYFTNPNLQQQPHQQQQQLQQLQQQPRLSVGNLEDVMLSRSSSMDLSAGTSDGQYSLLSSMPQQMSAPTFTTGMSWWNEFPATEPEMPMMAAPVDFQNPSFSQPMYPQFDESAYGMNMASTLNPRASFNAGVPTTMASPMMPPSPHSASYPAVTMYSPSQMAPTFVPNYPQNMRGASVGSNGENNSDDGGSHQKQTCPQCKKKFKDLKAHKLTHQEERPEKCPIPSCEYHVKGFSRRYDRNRHTLTHYKGNMVCPFCPSTGFPHEKTFNRADLFKRHLNTSHGVEQAPPNSRRRSGAVRPCGEDVVDINGNKIGPCSTCSLHYRTPQEFYEHLDECVLRIVQQADPIEVINAKCLESIANNADVVATLERNKVANPPDMQNFEDDLTMDDQEDAEELEDAEADIDPSLLDGVKSKAKIAKIANLKKSNPNGIQKKSAGMTHSRGGMPALQRKGRKPRREYPTSWGYDKDHVSMKKRVLTCFNGSRRLVKDDILLNNEHEVRVSLTENTWVTDLDIHSLSRAQGFVEAAPEHLDSWVSDDPTDEDRRKMELVAMKQEGDL